MSYELEDWEPEVYDVVEAPDETECEIVTRNEDGGIKHCDSDADYIVVYQGNVDPVVDPPRNVLSCRFCWPCNSDDVREVGR